MTSLENMKRELRERFERLNRKKYCEKAVRDMIKILSKDFEVRSPRLRVDPELIQRIFKPTKYYGGWSEYEIGTETMVLIPYPTVRSILHEFYHHLKKVKNEPESEEEAWEFSEKYIPKYESLIPKECRFENIYMKRI